GGQRLERRDRHRAGAVPARRGHDAVRGHRGERVRGQQVTALRPVQRHRQSPPWTDSLPVRRPRRRRKYAWGPALLLVSPSLLAIGIFVYGFLGWNLRVSFTSWRGLTPKYDFVGLRNYTALWQDRRWLIDVNNIVIFTVVFVLGALALGFLMAYLIERGVHGE